MVKLSSRPQWEKESLFSKWCWENWISIGTKMKLDPDIMLYTKSNSKWIKDLDIRLKAINILEENLSYIMILYFRMISRYDAKSTGNKSKNRQMRLHQTKSFSTVKETMKWKSKLQNMRKYLQTIYLVRGHGTLTI